MFFKEKSASSSGRIVIIGAGEVGFHTTRRLAEEQRQVIVIDHDEEQLRKIQEAFDVQTLTGSGASPQVLRDAGIDKAELVLAVTNSDEVNIMACMFARELAPQATRVARVRNPDYHLLPGFLEKSLGLSLLVNPEEEIVRSISRLITMPGSVEYHEFANRRIRMTGMKVDRGPLIDLPLFRFREVLQEERVMIGAIYREDRLIIPSGSDIIRQGDIVHFIYEPAALPSILRALEQKRRPVRSVCIYGAGLIGTALARSLESMNVQVCLIAGNAAECEKLSSSLGSTLILHGDARDRSLLEEEKIGEMDAFVAVSENEESNILSCMLAKKLGAGLAVASINKAEYLPLADTVGIDHIVSPRIATVSSILHYIRHGNVLASVAVSNEAAETMEVFVEQNSALCGRRLRDICLPKGVLFLAVVQGDNVFIPKGDTVIQPDARVLILAEKQHIAELERILGDAEASECGGSDL